MTKVYTNIGTKKEELVTSKQFLNNFRWAGVQGPTRKRINPNEEIHNRDLNINNQLNLDGDLYMEPGKSIPVHAR